MSELKKLPEFESLSETEKTELLAFERYVALRAGGLDVRAASRAIYGDDFAQHGPLPDPPSEEIGL